MRKFAVIMMFSLSFRTCWLGRREDVSASDVKCELCPVIHGALKRTVDGRFVHLCCLMAAPGARMSDLVNKTKIDIRKARR